MRKYEMTNIVNQRMLNVKEFPEHIAVSASDRFVPECKEMFAQVEHKAISRAFTIWGTDAQIIDAVEKYSLLTLDMIGCITGISDMYHISSRVQNLVDANYLDKYVFSNDGESITGVAYSLGYRGKGYLKSQGIRPKWDGFVREMNALSARKWLAACNFVISHPDISDCSMRKIINSQKNKIRNGKVFRAYAMFNADDTTYIVEPVRFDEDSDEELLDKLSRIKSTIHTKYCNVKSENYVVILQCENTFHMEHIRHLVHSKKFNFNLLFTYDGADAVYKEPKVFSVWNWLIGA